MTTSILSTLPVSSVTGVHRVAVASLPPCHGVPLFYVPKERNGSLGRHAHCVLAVAGGVGFRIGSIAHLDSGRIATLFRTAGITGPEPFREWITTRVGEALQRAASTGRPPLTSAEAAKALGLGELWAQAHAAASPRSVEVARSDLLDGAPVTAAMLEALARSLHIPVAPPTLRVLRTNVTTASVTADRRTGIAFEYSGQEPSLDGVNSFLCHLRDRASMESRCA